MVLASTMLGATAAADKGIGTETIEFDGGIPESDPVWVECVGDYVYGPFHVVAKTHAFETPSGTWHWIENWKLTQVLTGQATGWTWASNSVSPTRDNIVKNGETFGYAENGIAHPLDGGPTFRYSLNVKVKYDENGDPTLVIVKMATDDFKCLGKDK
jgi:hypothetical protein